MEKENVDTNTGASAPKKRHFSLSLKKRSRFSVFQKRRWTVSIPDAQSNLKRSLTMFKKMLRKLDLAYQRNWGSWSSEDVFLSECCKVDYIHS